MNMVLLYCGQEITKEQSKNNEKEVTKMEIKMKKIENGRYAIIGTTLIVEKDGNYWYATDTTTLQSVVDCECSRKDIIKSISGIANKYVVTECEKKHKTTKVVWRA